MTLLVPVLLTSSIIAHDKTVKLKDPQIRVHHTLESIDHWLKIYPDGKFVLCDGSGYDFKGLVKEKFPKANIECLTFTNNAELVEVHGKGYGEGEIIKFALENSEILGSSDSFVKCTGKLWVENFHECLQNIESNFLCQAYFSNVFSLKKTTLKYIDTRFYFFKKDFYYQYFLNAHESLSISSGHGIEESFFDITIKNDLSHFLLNHPVRILGVGGGSGNYYKNSIHRYLKDVLRLRIVRFCSAYKHLFI